MAEELSHEEKRKKIEKRDKLIALGISEEIINCLLTKKIKHDYEHDLIFKESMTPYFGLHDFYISELNFVKDKLLNYGLEFHQPISIAIYAIRDWYDIKFKRLDDDPDPEYASVVESLFKSWIESFSIYCSIKKGIPFDNEIININMEYIQSLDSGIYIDDYIPKNVIEFLECIKTIKGWAFLYAGYESYAEQNKDNKDENQIKKKLSFLTKLTSEQRSKLFELLVEEGFIPETTDKDYFNWAFGELGKIKPERYESIIWLKDYNLAVYLIDKLCFDSGRRIQGNYLSIGTKIFGIKNMAQIRYGYQNNEMGAPINSNQIDEIISKVKGII